MQRNLLRTFTITLSLLLGIAISTQWFHYRVTAASLVPTPLAAAPLPVATVNQSYSATIESTGGVAPYSFTLKTGNLPNGIGFNNGTFSGTPTQTGTSTFTIETTDSNGCTGSQEFSLRVQASPTIVPVNALSLAQGSNTISLTLATVNDVETAAGNLTVTANVVPAGLTLTNLTNDNGAIKATLAVACDASANAKVITLAVSDSFATVQAEVTVNVVTNNAPTFGTYANNSVTVFGSTIITPTAPPADAVAIADVSVAAPTFTGTISVNAAGVVSISNAGPVGTHNVTVTARDNCSLSTPRSFTLTINKATPDITWLNPANITYGTPLSVTQLNATANAAGNFTYMPPLNTVLNAGNGQTLTVNFTPSDPANFNNASQSVTINVLKAPLTVTPNNAWRNLNEANPPLTGSITGLVNGDVITPVYSTTALLTSAPGVYPITATLTDPGNRSGNYQITLQAGTLTIVNSCSLTLIPATLAPATLGQAYGQGLTVVGGTGAITFSVIAGALPPGLQLINAAGFFSLQGTPTAPGTYHFTLQGQQSGSSCLVARSYTLTIAPTIVPFLNCITTNADGSITARFGYENSTRTVVELPVGLNNFFSPNPQTRGQLTTFQMGRVNNAFTVTFANAGALAGWFVRGPDGVLRGVVPSLGSPRCP